MSGSGDLSGAWLGRYAYTGARMPAVNFLMLLEEHDGALSGRITERVRRRSGMIDAAAIVRGQREGRTVSWIKAYDGDGLFAHAVPYEGEIDADLTRIVGTWTLDGVTGTFVATRPPMPEEIACVEAVRVDQPEWT